ncbi:MAG TPA: dihydrofolate reductase family protein [Nitrososphaeraceae archaeon]|nr:dihydrofolate reductase family protein [Nitrososphaeraceae archaeon]
MQITVDGYIQDPEGRIDWVESWEDEYDLLDRVDLAVLGNGMYSGYEQYWTAALNPKGKLPFSGKEPTPGEVAYANWATRTPHIVISRKPLNVNWKNTRVVSDLEEIRELKQKTGKDIYAVGGATLVSALINHGLVDEIRLMVNPFLLGAGKALFNGLTERKHLKLESAEQRDPGKVYLIYSVQSK